MNLLQELSQTYLVYNDQPYDILVDQLKKKVARYNKAMEVKFNIETEALNYLAYRKHIKQVA